MSGRSSSDVGGGLLLPGRSAANHMVDDVGVRTTTASNSNPYHHHKDKHQEGGVGKGEGRGSFIIGVICDRRPWEGIHNPHI
jgi:hypothetical protein